MALIICPECEGKVSDKATSCPHCGYPINSNTECILEEKENHCLINGIDFDLTIVKNEVLAKGNNILIIGKIMDETGCNNAEVFKLIGYIQENKKIPETFEIENTSEERLKQAAQMFAEEAKHVPKCPTCGSTDVQMIGAGQKIGGTMLFGLFSSDIRNSYMCNHCGYKW